MDLLPCRALYQSPIQPARQAQSHRPPSRKVYGAAGREERCSSADFRRFRKHEFLICEICGPLFAMRTCVILNPIAGAVKSVDPIRERLRSLNPDRFHVSGQSGDAEKFAREASDFDLIVSAGGDGTLNEVVNGIALGGCKAALGVLPLGTGNDFARTLGVSNDLDAGINQIASGETRCIDLVRVTSDQVRYFANVSS